MDEEQLEGRFRNLTAQLQAVSFVAEYLLKHVFLTMPRAQRLRIAEGLLQAANDTSSFAGIAKDDDHAAEYLADVAVLAQAAVDRVIGKALRITAELEDEANERAGQKG